VAGRGFARKPAGAAADPRNGKQQLSRVDASGAPAELAVDVPARPRGQSAALRRAWDDFWASDIAYLLDRSDLHAVRRLFQLYAEREQCHEHVTSQRVTKLPLEEALKSGASGELVHELDDEGATHTFVLVQHDGRVAIGSQGQLVLSPYARDLRTIDSEIRQLEDRFGLNVRARGALAVAARRPAGGEEPPPPPPTAGGPSEADRALLEL
jgi:hypothetical protein